MHNYLVFNSKFAKLPLYFSAKTFERALFTKKMFEYNCCINCKIILTPEFYKKYNTIF